ncbi:hypothetical protein [Halobacteriovorax sp. YZS-1-2]|uniref:SMODS-associated NUDIX domain-containing protein n=1 Tax=Halobacteriovorax sp. YZS-1-2 TaxID=3391177 RepID=UPI003999D63C
MLLNKIYILASLIGLNIATIGAYKNNVFDENLVLVFLGIFASAFFTLLIELLVNHINIIWNIIRSVFHKKIRISFAQLIRVEIEDKYLLVLNSRIKNTFQPPGGAIQYYDNKILTEYSLSEDEGYRNSPKEDLRKTLIVPRKLCSLYDWFFSRKDREISPEREFREELLKTNILPSKEFDQIRLSYSKTVTPKIKYSDQFDKYECFIFEIFDFIPTDSQRSWMTENIKESNNDYILLSKEEISRGGYVASKNQSYQLGTQTKYIL